jgi:hypothetical protein
MHFAELIQIAGPLVFSLVVCLFAMLKGGSAERGGAIVILANMLIGVVIEATGPTQIEILSLDAFTAAALLIMALRYASFWLGAVMLLYALQFALHAYYFVLERPRDFLHVVLNNLDFFAVSLCLAAGTVVAWRRRRRAAAALAFA